AAYAMTAISVLVLLVIVALRKSIGTAIRVIKMGAQALTSHKSLLLFPLTTVISLLALLAYTVFVAGLLASAGEITTADVKDLAAEHMAAINQELEEKYGRSFTFGNVRLMPMPRHVVELSWRCVGLGLPSDVHLEPNLFNH
ncbi:unnamed protein product, partial [Symbiodinium sp. KB8]